MKILNEIQKNLKIIFRNPSSIGVMIIGPLLLILIIGFAFSSNTMNGIKIGIIGNIEPSLKLDISKFSEVISFENSDLCVKELKMQQMHLCMDLGKGFFIDEEGFPSGNIQFYYDNTRSGISTRVITSISELVGAKTEQISIETTKLIFSNIQEMVVFIAEKQRDVTDVKNQSESIREKLVERKNKLLEIKQKFQPNYYRVKEIQNLTKNSIYEFNERYDKFLFTIDEMIRLNRLQPVTDLIIGLNSGEYYAFPIESNVSGYYLSELGEFYVFNKTLEVAIENFSRSVNLSNIDDNDYVSLLSMQGANQFYSDSIELKKSAGEIANNANSSIYYIDLLSEQMDEINEIIEQEIRLTSILISAIDASIQKISEIDEQLTKDITKLNKLHPNFASKLISPITSVFNELIPDIEKIKIMFPMLLAVVLIFISMLFSNSLTLSEMHSSAGFRNSLAPVDKRLFSMGILITSIIVVGVQAIVLLTIGQFRFNVDIFRNFVEICAVCAILILIFSLIGMLIAYIFKNQQTSLITTTLASLAFFLFSNVAIPLEAMPELGAYFASMNPMVIAEEIFRKIMIFNLPIQQSSLALLLSYAIMLLIIVFSGKIINQK